MRCDPTLASARTLSAEHVTVAVPMGLEPPDSGEFAADVCELESLPSIGGRRIWDCEAARLPSAPRLPNTGASGLGSAFVIPSAMFVARRTLPDAFGADVDFLFDSAVVCAFVIRPPFR